MRRTYGVVWRDGGSPLAAGKLELLPRGVRLDGRDRSQDISYQELSGVHVGRTAAERINGRPSVVLERIGHMPVTIATVAQSSLVGEIAERLASYQLGAGAPRQLMLVLPLRPGAQDEVRQLLTQGPPFDPGEIPELERHEVLLTPAEAIFVFESEAGADAIAALLAKAELWQAAGAWQEHIAGPPRLAESVYSWARGEDPDEVFFLPTPGPGDSDGGDIF
jgi:hypothetical protein